MNRISEKHFDRPALHRGMGSCGVVVVVVVANVRSIDGNIFPYGSI